VFQTFDVQHLLVNYLPSFLHHVSIDSAKFLCYSKEKRGVRLSRGNKEEEEIEMLH